MAWITAAITDEYPQYKPGSLVVAFEVHDDMVEDKPVLLSYLRRRTLLSENLAELVERGPEGQGVPVPASPS